MVQALLEQQAIQETLVQVGHLDLKDRKEQLVMPDHQVQLDRTGILDSMEQMELQVLQDLQGLKDQLETRDHKDCKDNLDQLDRPDHLDPLEISDQPVQQDHPEL